MVVPGKVYGWNSRKAKTGTIQWNIGTGNESIVHVDGL